MRTEHQIVRVRLHDILAAISGIRETVGGLRFENYETVWWIKHACERGIEIISEASRHLPEELKQTAPEVPWRQIAGIGNVLRHEYSSISNHVMWDIIQNHLDPLEMAVRGMLKMVENRERRV